jgi:hypothetical protein
MPGPQKLTWKNARKIETVETRRVGPEVRNGAADHDLREEQEAHHDEVFKRGALTQGRLMGAASLAVADHCHANREN